MPDFKTLDVAQDDRGVCYVHLNVPEKRNAMSAQMIEDLTRLAEVLGKDATCRVVVLGGRGSVFCAGGDLVWMKTQIDADRATRIAEATKLAMMLKALNEMPKPLIGRIHGGAFGGGVGLACICDIAVAENGAKFGLTETRLGLIPATIGPYVVARMGEGYARRVFMSARVFEASEAVALDLVATSVGAAELDHAVEGEVAPYLKVAPGAVGAAKTLTRQLGPRIDEATIAETIEELADIWEGEEAEHGIDAFLQKRPARWTN